jgi:hypothetical protein
VTVNDVTEPFRVVLVWTDYPGAYGSTQNLVNDLDLRVQGPDGTTYLGNVTQGLNPGRSVTGGNPDRVNVEEGVFLPSSQFGLVAGTYTLTVEAINVPQGPQPYALVAVGGLEGGPIDTEAPEVASTNPTNGSYDVPLNAALSITFSEEMGHSPVANAFSIEPVVAGTFAWNGPTLTFTRSTLPEHDTVHFNGGDGFGREPVPSPFSSPLRAWELRLDRTLSLRRLQQCQRARHRVTRTRFIHISAQPQTATEIECSMFSTGAMGHRRQVPYFLRAPGLR